MEAIDPRSYGDEAEWSGERDRENERGRQKETQRERGRETYIECAKLHALGPTTERWREECRGVERVVER